MQMEEKTGWKRAWRTALLVAAACSLFVVTMEAGFALPGDAGAQGKEGKYRAAFLSAAGSPPNAIGTLYTDDGVYDLSVSDAAEYFAKSRIAFEEKARENAEADGRGSPGAAGPDDAGDDRPGNGTDRPRDGGRRGGDEPNRGRAGSSTDDPAFARAGMFTLWERAVLDGGSDPVGCSHMHENRHYTVRIPNPLAKDRIGGPFIGAAYSEIAAFGHGELTDAVTLDRVYYSYPVFYAGASSFLCYQIKNVVLNQPQVEGIIVGVDD